MFTKRQLSTLEYLETLDKKLPTTTKQKFLEANAIILAYVKEKDLVVYGGQAIDTLLSTKNKRIYNDETIPDIDVYSPNHIRDMVEVANRLFHAGFGYVMGIPRLHESSKAVKFNFMKENALDISYMPPEVIEIVGTFRHEGVRYISPDFIVCNIYTSLSRNSSLNYFRWKKDCDRLALVLEEFPEPPIPKLRPQSSYFREKIPDDGTWVEIYPNCIFSLYPQKHISQLDVVSSVLYDPVGIDAIPAHYSVQLKSKLKSQRVDIYYIGTNVCYVCNGSYPSIYLRKWFRSILRIMSPLLPEDFAIEETEFIDPKPGDYKCLGNRDAETYTQPTTESKIRVYKPETKIIDSEEIETPNSQHLLGRAQL